MAYSFGDSFDPYAAPADMVNGYWDSSAGAATFISPGRFTGSQGITLVNGSSFVKSSGVNDAVHHVVVSFRQTSALGAATLTGYLELFDGATAQCTVGFRGDGSIVLASGGPAGSVLATYSSAFVQNVWTAFEFEILINNTTGAFRVRKNGNPSNDFDSGATLNTRPVSTNNYANKLQIGGASVSFVHQIDDLFWQSGAAAGSWLGDIRCYARMPASDASVTFTKSTGASNFSCVDEAQQNALTDYVFDANPGDADFYGITTIASTPATVIATTIRAYMQKSDAGTRTAAVQLKSGATTVASPTLTLSSSGWLWAWRTDLTDPNTGAAWTAAAVNNVQIGPKTVA